MAHFYSDLFFYYVMPITKKYQQQSTYSGASTYSKDYTSSGTDSYTFTYSKTEVIWTKGGYRRGPGMKSPPVTMFSITSDLQDYEIDYISVGSNLSSSGMRAPSSGSNSYTVNVQRLISGSIQRVYIYLKYKNAFEIPLTSSGATTCKTAQKYCDKNIIVYPKLQEKTAAPTSASQAITADGGYAGLSKVTISTVPTETKTVTAGTSATTVTPTSGKFLTSVTVNPTPSEEKTVEITSSGNTVIAPSSGKLLSKVTVSPMLESYSVAAEATEKVVTPTDGYAGLSSVTIAAAPLQDITVTQATDIAQEITNPDPGYYGFGKITVPQLTGEEKTVTITENGTTTVNYSDPKLMSKVTITTNVPSITDVATAAEMDAVLVEANVGRTYRFTGTTDDTYTNGDLYEVVSG